MKKSTKGASQRPVRPWRRSASGRKVAVAMSGGVDSGVAALLLVKAGYNCIGFHMHLWKEPSSRAENKCCSTESLEAARRTAHKLGMPFRTVDLSKIFKKKVVDYFLAAYAAGLTPNPCVMCNRFIKFGELLTYVRRLGFEYLATGHYARVELRIANCELRIYHLLQVKDKTKDQSYFLYNLTQAQLARVLFPVGGLTKKKVRQMAKQARLPVAKRPESQEICFIPESDYRPFLKRQIGKKIMPGEVVDSQGRVVGRHQGIPLYTIGQRHGFEINSIRQLADEIRNSKLIPPYYVIEKDVKRNQLVVGFGKETERKNFWVGKINWIAGRPPKASRFCVRIRHQGELLPARLNMTKGKVHVVLDEPERGVAPGQTAVFYKGEEVVGGGIIET